MPGVVAFHPRATLPGKCNSNFPKENRGTERSRVLPEVAQQSGIRLRAAWLLHTAQSMEAFRERDSDLLGWWSY